MNAIKRKLWFFWGGTIVMPPDIPSYSPSLDYSDDRNSFYRAMGF